MKEQYRIQAEPVCRKGNIIQGACWRISVLTAGLVRLEYSQKGVFEDRPTQTVWNRDLGVCDYRVTDTEDSLEIITDRLHLHYDKGRFSADGLFIRVEGDFCRKRTSGTMETKLGQTRASCGERPGHSTARTVRSRLRTGWSPCAVMP